MQFLIIFLARKECVTPGQRLGHEDEFTAGPGTYVRDQYMYVFFIPSNNKSFVGQLPLKIQK